MELERKSLPEQHYLYVVREAGFTGTEIADAMGSGFGQVFGFVQQNGISALSMPVSLYMDMPNGPKMVFRCAMFVSADDAQKVQDPIEVGTIAAGDVVTGVHVGPYATLNVSHKALWDYCDEKGYTKAMPVWEHYVDDPTTVAEKDCRTEIYRRIE
ncbi:MAG: GyrI-like domain-containing protein [Gammaproteobacteria bacterium]